MVTHIMLQNVLQTPDPRFDSEHVISRYRNASFITPVLDRSIVRIKRRDPSNGDIDSATSPPAPTLIFTGIAKPINWFSEFYTSSPIRSRLTEKYAIYSVKDCPVHHINRS